MLSTLCFRNEIGVMEIITAIGTGGLKINFSAFYYFTLANCKISLSIHCSHRVISNYSIGYDSLW